MTRLARSRIDTRQFVKTTLALLPLMPRRKRKRIRDIAKAAQKMTKGKR